MVLCTLSCGLLPSSDRAVPLRPWLWFLANDVVPPQKGMVLLPPWQRLRLPLRPLSHSLLRRPPCSLRLPSRIIQLEGWLVGEQEIMVLSARRDWMRCSIRLSCWPRQLGSWLVATQEVMVLFSLRSWLCGLRAQALRLLGRALQLASRVVLREEVLVLCSRGQGMRERVRDGSIRHGNTWFVLSYGAELSDPSLSLDSEHPAGLQNRNGPVWLLARARKMAPALSPATPCSARSPKAARAQNAGKCKVRM